MVADVKPKVDEKKDSETLWNGIREETKDQKAANAKEATAAVVKVGEARVA